MSQQVQETQQSITFIGFSNQQRKLIEQLHAAAFDQDTLEKLPLEQRYVPVSLIAPGLLGPDMREMKPLILYGMVVDTIIPYEDDYDKGYALIEDGLKIAQHLAIMDSLPEFARAGAEAKLDSMMKKLISGTQKAREAAAVEAQERARRITAFTRLLRQMGLKDAAPTTPTYVHENVGFRIYSVSFDFETQVIDGTRQKVYNYDQVRFILTIFRVNSPEDNALIEEIKEFDPPYQFKHEDGGGYFHLNKTAVSCDINLTGYPYHDLTLPFWADGAAEMATFVSRMDADWQNIVTRWNDYKAKYDAWVEEQNRLEAEREEQRRQWQEEEDAALATAPESEHVPNPNAAYEDTAEWLERLVKSVRNGWKLDETDLWVLSTVRMARFIDRNVNGYEV